MREPKLSNYCNVLYDGRMCIARVKKVDKDKKTFDVLTSFNERIYNIPFNKFRDSISLGNMIVNMIEEEFSLGLKTVDAAAMTDKIDKLIQSKKWMLEI